MTDVLGFERAGDVAILTLNRPQTGNAIDMALAQALFEGAKEIEDDPAVRSVVLTGNGRLFCAGGDVQAFHSAGSSLPAFLLDITHYCHAALSIFARMDKPLVGAINGPAAGAGIGFALIGDIVLAEPSAHFTLAYTALGMSPDCGATWLLPRLVGARHAHELCLRNTRVDAALAAKIGMINSVVGEHTLRQQALELAQELASGSTSALARTRNLLARSFTSSLDEQLEAERLAIAEQSKSLDAREGISAFVEKRSPSFGRRI